MQSGISWDDCLYGVLFNYTVDFHLLMGISILGAFDITFIDALFFPLVDLIGGEEGAWVRFLERWF